MKKYVLMISAVCVMFVCLDLSKSWVWVRGVNFEASCTNQLTGQYSEYYSTNSIAVHICSEQIICSYPNNVFVFG